ncbi:hypothetical protein BDP27DRAFT_1323638 [Rhodocollybia butyracea]|uniref:Uncharacterized protein n=1 Tax=Rhodocollybia butyracea TaxID=206335 RepID=A0A9P5PWP7_9AGAR|nr:hypothetical protein BDP27DRAFT_1323638 [Rhodocollybia butyracea]
MVMKRWTNYKTLSTAGSVILPHTLLNDRRLFSSFSMLIIPRIHRLGLIFFSVFIFAVHGMPTRKPGPAQKEFVVTIFNEAFEPILDGVSATSKRQITRMIKAMFPLEDNIDMTKILGYNSARASDPQGPAVVTRFVLERHNGQPCTYFGYILPTQSDATGIAGSIFSLETDSNEHQGWKGKQWHPGHVEIDKVVEFDSKFHETLKTFSPEKWKAMIEKVREWKERLPKSNIAHLNPESRKNAIPDLKNPGPPADSPSRSSSESRISKSPEHPTYHDILHSLRGSAGPSAPQKHNDIPNPPYNPFLGVGGDYTDTHINNDYTKGLHES